MPKRVLIVDDSPSVRKVVCGLFTFEGFSVCGEAGDGAQAIEKAKQMEPDMIVLDFAMPVMDGIHAAKALQQIMPMFPSSCSLHMRAVPGKKMPWPQGLPLLFRKGTHRPS